MSTIDCGICFIQYNEQERTPRVLTSCGHTICQKCALKLTEDKKTITCPFDRKVTMLTRKTASDDVDGLQKNFALLDLARRANEEQEEGSSMKREEHVPCFEDASHEAVVYCQQCEVDFCDLCFTSVHKSKALSSHQKVKVSEKPIKLPKCPKHPHNIAEFFCTDAECTNSTKIMCQTCVLFDQHKSHEYDFLMEKLLEDEEERKEAQKFMEIFQEGAEATLEVVNQTIASYEVTGDAFKEAVQSISDQFDMMKREAIRELTQFAKEKKEERTELKRYFENKCSVVKEFKGMIEKLNTTNDESEIDDWTRRVESLLVSPSHWQYSLKDYEFIISEIKFQIKEKPDVPLPASWEKFMTDLERLCQEDSDE